MLCGAAPMTKSRTGSMLLFRKAKLSPCHYSGAVSVNPHQLDLRGFRVSGSLSFTEAHQRPKALRDVQVPDNPASLVLSHRCAS